MLVNEMATGVNITRFTNTQKASSTKRDSPLSFSIASLVLPDNEDANTRTLSKLNPRLTEALYHLQPTPTRTALAGSGSPKTYYDPTQPNQQGKNKNPIRGAAVLHMWAMQNGISAYSASGQRRSPGEFQVEHIFPLKSGGKDHINNFAMILRRENEPRADLPFEKFLAFNGNFMKFIL